MKDHMKIVVLAGGISTERDVSLSSGTMIYRALKKKGYRAVLLDVYLGYEANLTEADIEKLFQEERDWAKALGTITDKNPDIDQIKS